MCFIQYGLAADFWDGIGTHGALLPKRRSSLPRNIAYLQRCGIATADRILPMCQGNYMFFPMSQQQSFLV